MLLHAPLTHAQAACDSAHIAGGLRDAVVKVAVSDGIQQSGVVVAHDRVVTVWHGLVGNPQPQVHIDGAWYAASHVQYDAERDLALLTVPTLRATPVTLLDRTLQAGEAVWAFGWPAGQFQTVGEGVYLGDWRGAARITPLVEAGQSGGALIACHAGRALLAGLVTGFGARDFEGTLQREPNMSLAVPASVMLEFFEQSHAVSVARESDG
ncbi:MAG: serine protease [Pseudomonadota bacterium]